MPRAEILSKQAIHTLTRLHAELAGKIEDQPQERRQLYGLRWSRLKPSLR